mmetsp:Transcript_8966/g.14951  ORF Transcript_8966/g.14951 Transcript_8966/m.14951 type:complete len:219 (+) Transcript_8966:15-671(+)
MLSCVIIVPTRCASPCFINSMHRPKRNFLLTTIRSCDRAHKNHPSVQEPSNNHILKTTTRSDQHTEEMKKQKLEAGSNGNRSIVLEMGKQRRETQTVGAVRHQTTRTGPSSCEGASTPAGRMDQQQQHSKEVTKDDSVPNTANAETRFLPPIKNDERNAQQCSTNGKKRQRRCFIEELFTMDMLPSEEFGPGLDGSGTEKIDNILQEFQHDFDLEIPS